MICGRWIVSVVACGTGLWALIAVPAFPSDSSEPIASSGHSLELMRRSGDLTSQRRHVWNVFVRLTDTGTDNVEPRFESWYGDDQVFTNTAAEHSPKGIRAFSRVSPTDTTQSADAPILTYTLYNDAAYEHIRDNRLFLRAALESLRSTGPADAAVADDRSIPPFPIRAVVLKTVWWPVSKDGLTALPVWDPERNPPLRGGNSYISWHRVVAVDPVNRSQRYSTVHINFAGRSFPLAHRVGLDAFYHVTLDAGLAARIMRDSGAQKSASIALGRSLRAGDHIVLVAANLATREIADWVWAAFWWHDRPDKGPFAADRPGEVKSEWRNYLMQAAFDTDIPAAVDGGPHICFNPWLEGRFPDSGHGGGTESNCMTCHRRASYPPVGFLPVTRGGADLMKDNAYAPGRLRTSFLWSLALHAADEPSVGLRPEPHGRQ
jgi:hypothetical protein